MSCYNCPYCKIKQYAKLKDCKGADKMKENNYPPYNCGCGNYEEEKRDTYAEECYGIVEYRAYCKNCGAYIGHFVYGQWMLD